MFHVAMPFMTTKVFLKAQQKTVANVMRQKLNVYKKRIWDLMVTKKEEVMELMHKERKVFIELNSEKGIHKT